MNKTKARAVRIFLSRALLAAIIFGFFIFVPQAAAQQQEEKPYLPIVPCARQEQIESNSPDAVCTTCHFFVLVRNISDFSFKEVLPPLVAILVLVAGGMLMFASGNAALFAKGLALLRTTAIGTAITFGSWAGINTLMQQTAKYLYYSPAYEEVGGKWYTFPIFCGSGGGGGPPPPGDQPLECVPKSTDASVDQEQTFTANGGSGNYTWGAAEGNPAQGNGKSFTTKFNKSGTFDVVVTSDSNTATCRVTVTDQSAKCSFCENNAPAGTCPEFAGRTSISSTAAFCQQANITCSAAEVAGYDSVLASVLARQKIDFKEACSELKPAAFLKAWILQGQGGFGPFHLDPSRVNQFKDECKIGADIDRQFLENPANKEASACLAVELLAQTIDARGANCGCDERNIAAGFLAGPTACSENPVCANCVTCQTGLGLISGTRNWQCGWSDAGHSQCNSTNQIAPNLTYAQLRQKVPQVYACVEQLN